MRKMKKINGYLVVRFNDREKRQNPDTGLGSYGMIDAELYSGVLDVDRSAMEYDSADTLEEAIEQARGLESEMDVEEPEVKVTIITETDTETTEQTDIDPVDLFERESKLIKHQAENPDFPYINECAAAYHMRGYLSALQDLGIAGLDDDRFPIDLDEFDGHKLVLLSPEKIKELDTLNALFGEIEQYANGEPDILPHLSTQIDTPACSPYRPWDGFNERARKRGKFYNISANAVTASKVYALGLSLLDDCPGNDCTIFRETFRMCAETDDQLLRLTGWPRSVMEMQLNKRYHDLETMYRHNPAIRDYLVKQDMKE